MKTRTVLTVLILLASPGALADFDRGVDAYHRGDYPVAYQQLLGPATQGHSQAQYNLGTMLLHGMGIPQNLVEAAKWYERAAQQGHVLSQYELAKLYAYGRGVPINAQLSYVWFSIAAAQGDHKSEKNKAIMARYLSEPELDQADDLTAEYYTLYVTPFR